MILPILLAFFLAACPTTKHPTDKALEEIFLRHESQFEQLVNMARSDSRVVRIAPSFTWLIDDASWPRPASKIGFSSERWEEYRRLFGSLGLEGGLMHYPETGKIYFYSSSKGLVTGGSGKGYVYSENELTPVVDSLDLLPLEHLGGQPHKIAFKKINPHWYLFLEIH